MFSLSMAAILFGGVSSSFDMLRTDMFDGKKIEGRGSSKRIV